MNQKEPDIRFELSEVLLDFYNIFNAWEEESVEALQTRLSVQEVHTIECLGRRPGLKMRDLADMMEISTPSVTGVVDKLEKKGYARRKTTPTDRRVFLIELTHKGQLLYQKHTDQHREMAEKVMDCVPPDDFPKFIGALKNIVRMFTVPSPEG